MHNLLYGYIGNAQRMAKATDYMIAQGVEINTDLVYYGATGYMLRSPVNDSIRDIRRVDLNGEIGQWYIGYQKGVLPALCIDLTK